MNLKKLISSMLWGYMKNDCSTFTHYFRERSAPFSGVLARLAMDKRRTGTKERVRSHKSLSECCTHLLGKITKILHGWNSHFRRKHNPRLAGYGFECLAFSQSLIKTISINSQGIETVFSLTCQNLIFPN